MSRPSPRAAVPLQVPLLCNLQKGCSARLQRLPLLSRHLLRKGSAAGRLDEFVEAGKVLGGVGPCVLVPHSHPAYLSSDHVAEERLFEPTIIRRAFAKRHELAVALLPHVHGQVDCSHQVQLSNGTAEHVHFSVCG
eukprot:933227-Prymnesium_polylepis.1